VKIGSILTNALMASALAISQNLFFVSSSNQAKAQGSTQPYVVLVNGYQDCCIWDPRNRGVSEILLRKLQNLGADLRLVPWDTFRDGSRQRSSTSNDSAFLREGADFINNQLDKNRPLILIGHSFGGDSVLKLLPRINRRIQFVAVIDPVRTGGFRAPLKALTVPNTVDYFFNRWQNNEPFPNDFPLNGSIPCNAKTCDQDSQFAHTDETGNPIREKCGFLETCRTKQVRTGHQSLPTDDYIQKLIGDKIQKQLKLAQSAEKEWQEYPGTGLAKSLAVSQDGTPVIIGTDNKIYKGSGNGWVELSGTGLAMGIAIDGRGKTWIVGTDQRIYFHNRGSTWQEYPGTGLAKSLTVSQDGIPIIIGTDDKIYKGSGSGWVELSGTGLAVDVAVDGTGKTWIIGTDQRIYFHNGSAWQEYPGTGLAKSIAVSQDGIPVIIGTGDKIYRGSGSGWVELSGTGLAVDVDGTGKTWIIGTDQRIYFHL
jgi:hypothetical protein